MYPGPSRHDRYSGGLSVGRISTAEDRVEQSARRVAGLIEVGICEPGIIKISNGASPKPNKDYFASRGVKRAVVRTSLS